MSDRSASIISHTDNTVSDHPVSGEALQKLGLNVPSYMHKDCCDDVPKEEGVSREFEICAPEVYEDIGGKPSYTEAPYAAYKSRQKIETTECGTQSDHLQESVLSHIGVQAEEEDIGYPLYGDEDHGSMPQLECMEPDPTMPIGVGVRRMSIMGSDDGPFISQKAGITGDIGEEHYTDAVSGGTHHETGLPAINRHTVNDSPNALICEEVETSDGGQIDVINSDEEFAINDDDKDATDSVMLGANAPVKVQHHIQEENYLDESLCAEDSDDIIYPTSPCGDTLAIVDNPQGLTDSLTHGVDDSGKIPQVLTIPKPLLADYMPQCTPLTSKQMSALSAPFETRGGEIYATAPTPSDHHIGQDFLMPPVPMEGPHTTYRHIPGTVGRYTANPAMANFGQELQHYVDNTLALKEDEIEERNRFIRRIDRILHETISPTCELKLHGSYKTNLALKDSDIDFLVTNYGNNQPLHVMEQMRIALYEYSSDRETPVRPPVSEEATGSLLKRQAVTTPNSGTYVHVFEGKVFRVQSIVYTRVPVIKVVEIETGIKGDLSFGGGQHDDSMKLVQALLNRQPNARYLLLFLKFFVKESSIAEGTQGGITSFVLYLMVSHFFRVKFYADDRYEAPSGNLAELIAQRVPLHPAKNATTSSDSIAQLLIKGGSSEASDSSPEEVCKVVKSFLGVDGDIGKKDVDESKFPFRSDVTNEDDVPLNEKSECKNLDRPSVNLSEPPKENLKPPLVSSRVLTSIDEPVEEEGRDAEYQEPLGMGDVLLLFCRYYAEFKYDTKAIYFNQKGESFVVDRVQKPRPQHFQLTSPFDDTYDVTSRMTCTEDFQRVCGALYLFLMEHKMLSISTLVGSLHGDPGFMSLPPLPAHVGHHRYSRGGMGGYHGGNYAPFNPNNVGNQSPSSMPLHNPVAVRGGSGYGYTCYPRNNTMAHNMSSNGSQSHVGKVPASPGQPGLHQRSTSNSTPISSFDEGGIMENNNLDGANVRHNTRSNSTQLAKQPYLHQPPLHGINAAPSTMDGPSNVMQVSAGVNVQGSWNMNRNGSSEFSNYNNTPYMSEMASGTDPMVSMVSTTTQTSHHPTEQHTRNHVSPISGGGQQNMTSTDGGALNNPACGYLHNYYHQGASYPSNFYGPLAPAHHIPFHFNGGNFFTHPPQAGAGNQNYSSHGRSAQNQGSTNQQLGTPTQTPSKEPRSTKGNNNGGLTTIHLARTRRGGASQPQSSGRHDNQLGPAGGFDAFQILNSDGGPDTSSNAQRQRNNINTSDISVLDDNNRGPSAAAGNPVLPQGLHTNKVNNNTSQNHQHAISRHHNCNALYSSPPLQGQQPPYGSYPHHHHPAYSDYPLNNAHSNNGVLHQHHAYYGTVMSSSHSSGQQGNQGYGIVGGTPSQHQGSNSHNGPHNIGTYGGIPQAGYGQGNMGPSRPQGSSTPSNSHVLNNVNIRYSQHVHLPNTISNHPHQGTPIIQHHIHSHHLYGGSSVNGVTGNSRSSPEHQHQQQLAHYAALVRSGNPFQASGGVSSDSAPANVSSQPSNTNDTNSNSYGSDSQKTALSPAGHEPIISTDESSMQSPFSSGSVPLQRRTSGSKFYQRDSGGVLRQKAPTHSVPAALTSPTISPYPEILIVPNANPSSGVTPREKGKHVPQLKKGKHQDKGGKDKSTSSGITTAVTNEVEPCSQSEGVKPVITGKPDPTPRGSNKVRAGKGVKKDHIGTKQQCAAVEEEDKATCTSIGKCSLGGGKSSVTNRKSNLSSSGGDSATSSSNQNAEKAITNNRKGNKPSHQVSGPINVIISDSIDARNVDEGVPSVVTSAVMSASDVSSPLQQVGTQLYLPPSKRTNNIKAPAAESSTDCSLP